jgi:hypothetical protein
VSVTREGEEGRDREVKKIGDRNVDVEVEVEVEFCWRDDEEEMLGIRKGVRWIVKKIT